MLFEQGTFCQSSARKVQSQGVPGMNPFWWLEALDFLIELDWTWLKVPIVFGYALSFWISPFSLIELHRLFMIVHTLSLCCFLFNANYLHLFVPSNTSCFVGCTCASNLIKLSNGCVKYVVASIPMVFIYKMDIDKLWDKPIEMETTIGNQLIGLSLWKPN